MKNLSRIAVTSVIAMALAAPAYAQSAAPTPAPAQEQAPQASPSTPPASGSTDSAPTTSGQASPSTSSPSMSGQASPSGAAPTASAGGVITEQEPGQLMSSDLVGMKVVGADGSSIGDVKDLILDEQHTVTGAVLSVGGLLGLGAKKIAVPWDSLTVTEQDGSTVATANLSKEELAEMPEYKTQAEIQAEQSRTTTAPTTSGAGTVKQ